MTNIIILAESKLVELLREHYQAIISEVCGHIMCSPVTTSPPPPPSHGLGLAPLAVKPVR